MIDYLEIRNAEREIIGIIDTAQSIIWHSVHYGVGDFEIYITANETTVALLKEDNYITRADGNDEVGIIEGVNISFDEHNGLMITASGRFTKSILDRRHIYKLNGNSNTATVIRGNVELAIRQLVSDNAINCSFDSKRNISALELGELKDYAATIVDEYGNNAQKQVSYKNLLEYTDAVLLEYGLASKVILDRQTLKLQYVIYKGEDRSIENLAGNDPIIFSKEFDNLTDSVYSLDTSLEKNVALIGGAGEGIERFYSLIGSQSDLQRREMWVDASSVNRTYKDENEVEQPYSDSTYKAMIDVQGMQQLSGQRKIESFTGTIDVTNSQWQVNRDYFIGDIVTMQDYFLGISVNVQIKETTEVQDADGYHIDVVYE